MEAAGLVLDAFGRVRDNVRVALKDLSSEELLAPPKLGSGRGKKVTEQRAVLFSGPTSQKNFSRSAVQLKAVQLGRIPA